MTTAQDAQPATTAPADRPARARIEPLHVLLALAAAAAVGVLLGPITDLDVYWHVLVGREILDTGRVSGLGTAWSLNLTGTDWRTTQWLSEVVLAKTQEWFGWGGVVALRDVLGVVLILLLARQLLRRAVPRVAAPVFAVVIIPVASSVQDRPMLVSLLFAVWLGGVAVDLLLDGRRPNLWLTAGLVVLWANLHGGWVLAPIVFGTVAVGAALEGGQQWGRARSAAAALAVSIGAGCLTPVGPAGLLEPFRFRAATRLIVEWAPTQVWGPYGIAVGIVLGALVWTWARGRVRPAPAELVYVAAMTAFAMQAYRNVAPALILLAPLLVERISRSYTVRRATVGRRESVLLWTLVGAIGLGAAGLLVTSLVREDPLEAAAPLAIARTLAETPGEKRVLNAYNASGVLAAFGGPGVRLAVDGRADRFGSDFIERYTSAGTLQDDWQAVLREVDPDVAVIRGDSQLARELQSEGWTLVQTDGRYVLLVDRR